MHSHASQGKYFESLFVLLYHNFAGFEVIMAITTRFDYFNWCIYVTDSNSVKVADVPFTIVTNMETRRRDVYDTYECANTI